MNTLQLKTVMMSMGRADLPLKANFFQLALLLPLTVYAMNFGVVALMVAWVVTELLVMLAVIQMSKAVLDTSFTRMLRCYRPALVSSIVMALCVIGVKALLGNQNGMVVLLVAITTGAITYYLAARFIFLKEFQTAFRVVFGNRFVFLSARTG